MREPEKALSFASKAQGQELLEQQRSLHREIKKLRGVFRKKVKNALRMLCKRAIQKDLLKWKKFILFFFENQEKISF
ncbi:hypothetical protein CpecG_0531 [Chlamydia pecorum MC/MarsBar]|nr:hypothetical protein CpecG_0531 [Chlamydia pecorum MC/MarsBar]